MMTTKPNDRVRVCGSTTLVDYTFDAAREGESGLAGRSLKAGILFEDDKKIGPYIEFRRSDDRTLDQDLRVRITGKPELASFIAEGRLLAIEGDARVRAELDALPDSAFLAGLDQIVHAGQTFRLGDRVLTVVGFVRRKLWDDASDQWAWQDAVGCRPATPEESIAAGYAP